MQFIFAGKAHPRDDDGKRYIQRIIHLSKFSELKGHLVFIENYDVHVARQMVSGCDVWLNNPRRPLEASGTSGQKAGCHGCLNLSIMDGWWREGYDGTNGFAIGGDSHPASIEEQDQQDSANLYQALTEQVIPAFYNRDDRGIPRQWLQMIRRAMVTLVPQYNTWRMVQEYTRKYYSDKRVSYEAVIGLETHVQLKTRSKMWCGCANHFGAPPNTHVCPVCLGLPGVLPVANEEALRLTALTGLLLKCTVRALREIRPEELFLSGHAQELSNHAIRQTLHRRADLLILSSTAALAQINITRAHLEEDVGKNFHFDRHSGVDFNRAGVPLLEIVSEPEITGADMAYEYLNALVEILRYGGISDCGHGKRHSPLRRQCQRPPAGREGVGQEDRNQKHEQLQRRAPGAGARNPAANRSFAKRRALDPGNPPLGRCRRHHRIHAQQGNGPRLPLFPGTGPDAAGDRPSDWLKEVSQRVVELAAGQETTPHAANINCPRQTRKPLCGTARWATISSRSPRARKIPKPPPIGSSTTCAPNWPPRAGRWPN